MANIFNKLVSSFMRGGSTSTTKTTRRPEEQMTSFSDAPEMSVLSNLPEQPPVKPPRKPAALASYIGSAKSGDTLPQTDRRLVNKDITTYRNESDTRRVIRGFAASSPDFASAIFSYLRTGITQGYTALARNTDGTFNREATVLLQQIITRMDVLPNYADGYSGSSSLQSLAEMLGKELLLEGAMAAELVLDKVYTPRKIQPLHVGSIKFKVDKDEVIPYQDINSQKIDLDIPTFFYVALDQDLLTAYASSPLEPAVKPVLFTEDFVQDLWRVVKKAVHPRETVTIDYDRIMKMIPADVQGDDNLTTEWMNTLLTQVEDQISNLGVDEALVLFDFIKIERETSGNTSLSSEWAALQDIGNAKLATGAKTMPAMLGHGVGSSNIASTESMLFIKSATGAIQVKLNEMFSRIFTLSLRLFGLDVYVEFKYNAVDLRPENELESFKAMKQSRILEQLSLGMVSDEEATIQLTGNLPPIGMTPLSGTRFTFGSPEVGNPNSNQGAVEQTTTPSTPAGGARGSNTKNNRR